MNDAPQALGESADATEDTALLIDPADLLKNDTDIDDDQTTLTITAVGSCQHGSVSLVTLEAGVQKILFTPEANYHGNASFEYTVSDPQGLSSTAIATLAIAGVNDAPVTANETAQTDEDVGLVFTQAQLLLNDSDPDIASDGDSLHISRVGEASHGDVSMNEAHEVTFAPEANYHGLAQFTYWVADSHEVETAATVSLTIAAVNDVPVATGEQVLGTEDTTLLINVADLLANDSDVDKATDGQVLSVSAVSGASHGTVMLLDNGTIRFEPEANYNGMATFNYTVSDGVGGTVVATAVVSLASVNDAPVTVSESASGSEDNELLFNSAALLANDSDVDGDSLHLSRVGDASNGTVSLDAWGQVHFTPTANYHGPAKFTYWVADPSGAETPATVSLTITPVNDLPVVTGEVVNGSEDTGLLFNPATLLVNDSDVDTLTDGQVLTISAVSNAQHGAVSVQSNGQIAFVPDSNFYGAASFDYTVSDGDGAGAGGTSVATVTMNLAAVNDAPVAANVTSVANATHGKVELNTDGNAVFTPDANYNGSASFQYQVSDPDGGSSWATANLTIKPVNDAPIIEDVWYGRPIFGYLYNIDINPFDPSQCWAPVENQQQAISLYQQGQLYAGYYETRGVRVTNLAYYQNGMLRPSGFDFNDGLWEFRTDQGNIYYTWDDPRRQNGYVVAYDPDGDSNTLTFSIVATDNPEHGYAVVNQYTAPWSWTCFGPLAPYWIKETGAWQYVSHDGDGYTGPDPFQVTVTDAGGASSTYEINGIHRGTSIPPVTLDLDGNGLSYVGIDDSKAYFDVNADGWRERMAWVGAGDGLLALDLDGDHRINKWNEISFVSYKEGAQTDLEGLQAFDSNHDGKLDRMDARWQQFGAWVDANGDGVCDVGEFKNLDDLRIASISLSSDHVQTDPAHGVTQLGQGSFSTVDGHTHSLGDVAFAADLTDRSPLPVVTTTVTEVSTTIDPLAAIMHQALSFNQWVASASFDVASEPASAFVPNELITADWVQPELLALVESQRTAGAQPA